MRSVYIGNLGDGSAPHSTENHVARALDVNGHEVVRFHEQRFGWDPAAVPDVAFVLWTHTHGFAPERTHGAQERFLAGLRARGIPSVGYHLDRWWDLAREPQVATEPFFRCDLVCTADGGNQDRFDAAGVNHEWFPPAVSEAECQPGTWRPDLAADVAFVGSWAGGYHPESRHRYELVEWLRDNYGWCTFVPAVGQPAVRGERLRDLYASVNVVVGDSCLVGTGRNVRYISDRIPETLGRGGFLIHPRVEGVTDGALYTEGEHLWCWDAGDWDGLTAAVDLALADDEERRRVANAGREHVLARHTYEVRMAQLVDVLVERGLVADGVAA